MIRPSDMDPATQFQSGDGGLLISTIVHEPSAAEPARSPRFNQRKEAILHAAAALINRLGLGDTTLGVVADEIGLNLKSLRYYFEKREDLVVAAFTRSIALHRELVDAAFTQASPELRIRRYVSEYFAMHARVARGEQPQFAYFSDLRAVTEPHSLRVYSQYTDLFRATRTLLHTPGDTWSRRELNARTHQLISQLSWAVGWINGYVPQDFQRVADRMTDLLLNGMALRQVDLSQMIVGAPPPESGRLSQESFLRTATMLINEQGYRGASVEKISATLNVTTGAFYHHNETRDALVVACFDRTLEVLGQAQDLAMSSDLDGASRVSATAVGLVARQMKAEGTMLRTTALTVVGPELRAEIMRRLSLISFRFADMLNDGLADGSVRVCDLRIASEMVMATVNSAAELGRWVEEPSESDVADLYVRPLLYGLINSAGRAAAG